MQSLTPPGDISITLAAMVARALAAQPIAIRNASTAPAVATLTAALDALGDRPPFHDPAGPLDCGDSAAVAELLLGLCAGAGITATLTGTSSAPLEPTAAQLRAFGAQIETTKGTLPATIRGAKHVQTRAFLLVAPTFATGAALEIAARVAQAPIVVTGDKSYDDSAERLFAYLDATGAGEITIPGDFGIAAAAIVEAVLTPGTTTRIDGAGVNPLRAGLLDVLDAMGAPVARENERSVSGEPVADLIVTSSPLAGITIAGDLLARSRRELPLISRLAVNAKGETRILGRALPDPSVEHERLPNGIAISGRIADTTNVSEIRA